MGTETAIAWTDHTFNIAWGCTKVSPGCAHCYADAFSQRLGMDIWGPGKARRTWPAASDHWTEPLRWDNRARMEAGLLGPGQPRLVFSASMCDLWEDHPTITREREKLWALIRQTPNLHWQLLTKRPERIAGNLPHDWSEWSDRIWLGTSVESAEYARRIDHIRDIPAAVHFISYEPALGPLGAIDLTHIEWVIFGGESGKGFRAPPDWRDWARAMRHRCARRGVAFFFKQSPAFRTEMGTTLDGETVRQFPSLIPAIPLVPSVP